MSILNEQLMLYLIIELKIMLPFFRKIRWRLAANNQFFKYSRYAIGEIVLVVIGILIALQINNWNENKKLRSTEQQYLLSLKEEFNFNKAELKRIMERNGKNADNAMKIIDNMGPEDPDITEEELVVLMAGSLLSDIQFEPNQGVLDEIISSGKLGMFSNHELKFTLSSWNGLLQKTKLNEEELQRLRYLTVDIVRNEANLRKTIYGPILEGYEIKQSKFKKGNLHLLQSLSFEGHMTGMVAMSLGLNNYDYLKFSRKIDRILLLIDDELK